MRYSRDIRALISHSMRENAVLVAVVLLHLAVAVLLARHYHFHVALDWSVQLPLFITCYLLLLVPAYFWMLARHRPARPIRFTTELLKRWRPHERLVVALPALVALGVFISAFGSLKSAIPRMEPYHLDPLFSHMDTAIHGEAPWRLLQPILGHPLFSFILNGAYELWMAVFYLALCAVAIWVDELELRRRFLTAFVLCWVLLGNLAATLLASVGPCFYGAFYHADPYVGLMGYLHQANSVFPMVTLQVQDQLIAWARAGMPGLGRGISAMPSVHVATACLLMLLGWKIGPRWGVAGTVFLLVIMIGSIHLGFHYAVDGYASLIATPAIWWLSKHVSALHRLRLPWSLQPALAEGAVEA